VPVTAVVTDLMDRSRIAAALPATRFVADSSAVGNDAELIVIDLARAAPAIAELRATRPGARILAFGSHVDREAAAGAEADGAHLVLTRSKFFADPAGAVRDLAAQTIGQGTE